MADKQAALRADASNIEAAPDMNAVRDRLEEIVAAVSDESIDLDEALSLYEEAVALGLAACETSADAVVAATETVDAEEAAEGEVGGAVSPSAGIAPAADGTTGS